MSIFDDDALDVKDAARLEDDIEPKCRDEPLRGIPLAAGPWLEVEEEAVRACEGDENILEKALRAFDLIEDRKPSFLSPRPSTGPTRFDAVGVEPMPDPSPYEMCRAGVVCVAAVWLLCAASGARVRTFGVEGESPSFSQSSVDRSDSTPPEDDRTSEPSATANWDEVEGDMVLPNLGGVRGRSLTAAGCPPKVDAGAARGVDLVDELSRDEGPGEVLADSALTCGAKENDQSECVAVRFGFCKPSRRTRDAKSRLDLVLGMSL